MGCKISIEMGGQAPEGARTSGKNVSRIAGNSLSRWQHYYIIAHATVNRFSPVLANSGVLERKVKLEESEYNQVQPNGLHPSCSVVAWLGV